MPLRIPKDGSKQQRLVRRCFGFCLFLTLQLVALMALDSETFKENPILMIVAGIALLIQAAGAFVFFRYEQLAGVGAYLRR